MDNGTSYSTGSGKASMAGIARFKLQSITMYPVSSYGHESLSVLKR